MYLPLHKIEDHFDECRERYVECPKQNCRQKIVKHSELERHNEEIHPVKVAKKCDVCFASYWLNEQSSHSCIGYVLEILKQVVGANPFEMAVKKVNAKYASAEQETPPGSRSKQQ